jgi:hypothetical protein
MHYHKNICTCLLDKCSRILSMHTAVSVLLFVDGEFHLGSTPQLGRGLLVAWMQKWRAWGVFTFTIILLLLLAISLCVVRSIDWVPNSDCAQKVRKVWTKDTRLLHNPITVFEPLIDVIPHREENFGRTFCKSIKALTKFLFVFCVEDSTHFLVLQEPSVHKLWGNCVIWLARWGISKKCNKPSCHRARTLVNQSTKIRCKADAATVN